MTHRDTLTASSDPHTLAEARRMAIEAIRRADLERGEAAIEDALGRMEAEDRQVGMAAADRYLESHEIPETEPPTPWLALLAVVLIVVLICVAVFKGAEWWQAMTVGCVMSAGASIAWGGLVAEAGRDAGVVR